MGTFEKLGILVIVVIIVMILAVAIHQWGGNGPEAMAEASSAAGLTVTSRDFEQLIKEDTEASKNAPVPVPDAGTWSGGVPKRYRVAPDDKVWAIVVKRWGLKESFIQAIEQANPRIDFKKLRPGNELVIPDPSAYVRSAAEKSESQSKRPAGTRLYEVKTGDTLEIIAYLHLGAKTRWREILSLNPGLDPRKLIEGQEIYLPAK